MSRARALLTAAALAAGCRGTEMVVVVRSDLPSLTAARIEVWKGADPGPTTSADLMTPCGCVGAGALCTQLPLELGLVPDDVDKATPFTVAATGYSDRSCGATLVTQRARVSFVKGERVALYLDLLTDCAGVTCDAPGTTCRHHQCVSDRTDDLPSFDPQADGPPLDADAAAGRDLRGPPSDFTGVVLDLAGDDLASATADLASTTDDLASPTDDLASPTIDGGAPTRDLSAPQFDLLPGSDDLGAPAVDLSLPVNDLATGAEDLSIVAQPSDFGCFLGGTLVRTADGEERAIESFAVGDRVLALDAERPLAELPTPGVVAHAVGHIAHEVVALRFGATSIVATLEHPFFVPGRGFVGAGALAPGDAVLDVSGATQRLDAAARLEGSFPVYNLELTAGHAYFVSPLGLVVHNGMSSF